MALRMTLMILLISTPLWGEELPTMERLWNEWSRATNYPTQVVLDSAISQACRARAQALVKQGALSHYDQLDRGPGEQMVLLTGRVGEWGEVLGAGSSVEKVFDAWIASPRHHDVLSDRRWVSWGWGSAKSGETEVYVVRFWRP